jgi:hypothetical protein
MLLLRSVEQGLLDVADFEVGAVLMQIASFPKLILGEMPAPMADATMARVRR